MSKYISTSLYISHSNLNFRQNFLLSTQIWNSCFSTTTSPAQPLPQAHFICKLYWSPCKNGRRGWSEAFTSKGYFVQSADGSETKVCHQSSSETGIEEYRGQTEGWRSQFTTSDTIVCRCKRSWSGWRLGIFWRINALEICSWRML